MVFIFRTSRKEVHDLLEAWILISLAFAIVMTGGLSFSSAMIKSFFLSAFTVGIGFLFHELGHKIVAQMYGCFAEFRASMKMLILAIIFSFFGFLFAAPGAVVISGQVSKRQNGKIAAAGPIVNLMLSALFIPLFFLSQAVGLSVLQELASYGIWVNAFLALFNMMPFFVLDGKKVLVWSRKAYIMILVPAIILLFFAGAFLGF